MNPGELSLARMEFRLTSSIFSSRFGPWLRLMRFDRPIGIALLLWPTWWGLFMAGGGRPDIGNLLIFTAGVVVMRAAGCVINDFADRDLDPHVARTVSRPLAPASWRRARRSSCFFGLMAIAFGLVLLTNPLTVLMAFFGALLAGTYPFFKRFTHCRRPRWAPRSPGRFRWHSPPRPGRSPSRPGGCSR